MCAGYSKKGGVAFALIIKELCFKNVLLAMCASAAEGKVHIQLCVRDDIGGGSISATINTPTVRQSHRFCTINTPTVRPR